MQDALPGAGSCAIARCPAVARYLAKAGKRQRKSRLERDGESGEWEGGGKARRKHHQRSAARAGAPAPAPQPGPVHVPTTPAA